MDAQPEKHIFISYSRNDGEPYVSQLEQRLGVHHRVWRDKRDLRPDQDFTADIERGIEAASHVVVCLTPDTKRDNSFVRREIQYALAIKRPVIPVRCADIPPHVSIVNNEWVDYFRDADAAITRLLEIVSKPDYANKPSENATDPFREYLEEALKFIVDGLDQRIIRLIDLKAAPQSDAVNFTPPPPERASIFKQAFSGVKMNQPEKPPEKFDTFQAGFKLYNERALLLGQPGAGKTITLMAHARDAYAARLANPSQPLPLFGLVATWNPKTKPPLSDWLAESLNLDSKLLRDEIDGGRALLLLDGLDELRAIDDAPDERAHSRAPLQDTLEKPDPRRDFLDALPANNRILLTCRIEDYAEIGQKATLNGAITLRDLTAEQVQTYLADQPHLLKLIESDTQLRELTQTPLLLSIFAFAYQDMTDTERQQLAAIDSAGELRDKIFMRYIDQRYEHEADKVGAEMPLTLEELKEALGRLAMENAAGGRWRDKQHKYRTIFPNVIEQGWITSREIIPNVDTLLSLAETLRLLARGEDKAYHFGHLLLRDALAFTHALLSLVDPNANVRRRAAAALRRILDVRAVEPLIAALRDADMHVRLNAAYTLGAINDTRAVEPLIAALRDADVQVRFNAARALGAIKDARAVPDLIEALSDRGIDPYRRRVCFAAADALVEIGEPAFGSLITALNDPDAHVRFNAAGALGAIKNARAVQPLINAFRDPDSDVGMSAAEALVRIGEPAFDSLIAALGDPDSDVRSNSAFALGQIKDTRAVLPLIAALHDPDSDVRYDAAEALGKIKDRRAVEPLIDTLSDHNVTVRSNAAVALGQIKDRRAVEPLINALRDPDHDVRSSTVGALGQIKDRRAVEPLINALHDRNVGVRRSTARVLARIGDGRAVDAFINALHDPDDSVRSSAVKALGRIGDKRSVEPLINALRDLNVGVRLSATIALGKIGDKRAVESLIHALADPAFYIRDSTALALGEIGDARAIEPLITALHDPVDYVCSCAAKALERIGTPEALAAVEAWRKEQSRDQKG